MRAVTGALSAVFLLLLPSIASADTWAVLVDASRYYFNYRHASNTLVVYKLLRDMGVPDDQIILMIADDPMASPRNPLPGGMFTDTTHNENIYDPLPEIDYAGDDVSAQSVIEVISGRHPPGTPLRRQLRSSNESDVLFYLTGHGGDGFLKFRDVEEITVADLSRAICVAAGGAATHAHRPPEPGVPRRFRRMLMVADTCQAASLLQATQACDGVAGVASSLVGENSYSTNSDSEVGASLMDRFTLSLAGALRRAGAAAARGSAPPSSAPTLLDTVASFSPARLNSHVGLAEPRSWGAKFDPRSGDPPLPRAAKRRPTHARDGEGEEAGGAAGGDSFALGSVSLLTFFSQPARGSSAAAVASTAASAPGVEILAHDGDEQGDGDLSFPFLALRGE